MDQVSSKKRTMGKLEKGEYTKSTQPPLENHPSSDKNLYKISPELQYLQ